MQASQTEDMKPNLVEHAHGPDLLPLIFDIVDVSLDLLVSLSCVLML